jgi:hypothetical protein
MDLTPSSGKKWRFLIFKDFEDFKSRQLIKTNTWEVVI